MNNRILIVEDDATLLKVLSDNLKLEGFDTLGVASADRAARAVTEFAPDLVLLDAMLPGGNGFDLCRAWRSRRGMSIIMLTALGARADKLRGLKVGADDYISKPFDLEELLLRIHAVLRRTRPKVDHLTLGRVTVDFRLLRASIGDRTLALTHKEFAILEYLAARPDQVVAREELLRTVWRYAEDANTRAVDHAISRLRRKIEPEYHKPKFIHTVHGDGYCLTLPHDT